MCSQRDLWVTPPRFGADPVNQCERGSQLLLPLQRLQPGAGRRCREVQPLLAAGLRCGEGTARTLLRAVVEHFIPWDLSTEHCACAKAQLCRCRRVNPLQSISARREHPCSRGPSAA